MPGEQATPIPLRAAMDQQQVMSTEELIAFGSLGQYVQAADHIYNVTAINVSVTQNVKPLTGGSLVSGGAYFKSWVGHADGTPPEGEGGGIGRVSNVSFTGLTTIFENKIIEDTLI